MNVLKEAARDFVKKHNLTEERLTVCKIRQIITDSYGFSIYEYNNVSKPGVEAVFNGIGALEY